MRIQGLFFSAALCHLPFAASIAAELKVPEAPFQDKGMIADRQKATPAIGQDGVRLGEKELRISGGFNFTRFLDRGKVVLALDGRIEPSPRWAPFEQFTTSFDEGTRSVLNESAFELVGGKKGLFRERARLTPENKIELSFSYEVPEEVKEKPSQVLTVSVPTAFLLGKKIQVDEHDAAQLPDDVEAFAKLKLPESGGGVGETRRVFLNPKRLVLAAGDARNTFALEFSPEVVRISINLGKTDTQIGLGYKNRCEPFTITLDPGNCFEVSKTDCMVGGVNYTQNNAFEAAVFDEERNVLMNPSFESGTQYWKVSDEHGDIESILCPTGAHSGKYCALLRSAKSTGPATLKSVGTIVYPDTDYTLSAWIKSSDGKPTGLSIHPRGPGGPGNWAKAGGVETKEPHGAWQRFGYTFRTPPGVHNLVLWLSSARNNLLLDDFQLEKGDAMSAYAGNRIGMELLTGSPDRQVVDAEAPVRARLLFRAASGQTGSADITVTDFFGRKLLEKTVRIKIGAGGEQIVRIGPDSLFPMGTTIIRTVVRADGQKAYTDFRRLIRIPYADNTAKRKTLQSSGPYLHSALAQCPESLARLFRAFGIGAFSYTHKLEGRQTEAEHAVMGQYGIVDFWGGVLWNTCWKDMINGQPWIWNGEPVQRLESYPPELLKWAEEMAYEQTKTSPWIGYWSMPTEPMGVYKTLQHGNFNEYAKLMLAINRGVMRADPDAVFCAFGVWNLFAQGRNDEYAFYRAASKLEPQTKFKVVDIHAYRSFPESPDVEEDLLAFMDGLAKIGYPDVKIKIGEGSYYYPMIAPESGLAPWTGVGTKDGYYDVAIPSYDLGWGERIGAAQVTRETLVYYKHADRVVNNCSWCPPFIDNRTPISWWAANAALIDLLGNADFKEDIRFASYSRAYLFEDPKGRTIAALWKFDEKFDRGLAGGTTMSLKLDRRARPEFIDLMGNVCDVPVKGSRYQVPLSGFPVYIRVAKGKRALLAEAIRECEVAADDTLLPLQFSVTVQTRTTASVKVINPLSRPLAAEVGIAGGSTLKSVAAKPNSAEPVEVELSQPVSDNGFESLSIPIRARFKGRDYNEDFKAVALAVHRVKEGFSWNEVPSVTVPHRHTMAKNFAWQGQADLSATCRFAWNEKALYLRFEVDDNAFVCPASGTPWSSYWDYDSVQLFFDSFCDAQEKAKKGITGFDTNDFSYELLPDSATSAVVYRRIAPDIQLTGGALHAFEANVLEKTASCTFRYENGKRVYDAAFPLRTLMPIPLTEGTSFGFGFEIYDRDDAQKPAPQKLSNVPASACGHPHLYPQLILVR